ncbi:hypothetical protein EIN_153130 [Entamoeba invadens IP1]|uniref:dAMP1 SANT/Myb-like domain-containing protein n=1 Tax=Entamoeba invadens IP1 TaxID=370355 RepID=A0A0A1UEQ1_ENTIV|nr:hypothetical protein EIN_153130 [Entamoeba invadens IP1]ELP91306.1 hypothetical protein EIN_153130 [Entamoeba invadens IP1]|eukprot:XP_004258077.1 hypothetical protein EIN_153130 [Entamoeba invadens IP1]
MSIGKPTLPSFNTTLPSGIGLSSKQNETQHHYLEINTIEMYTTEEYDKYLQHKEWTRATTDSMMEYVKQYGMCWEVVHDRLVVYNEFRLSVDAVIERYLQIAMKLSQNRFTEKYPANSFIHPYDFFPFDRRFEEQRKEDGMQQLIENVVSLPQAKLFLSQTLLTKKEVQEDHVGSNAILDSLAPGVYSRFQLLMERTDLSKLGLYFDKDTTLSLLR